MDNSPPPVSIFGVPFALFSIAGMLFGFLIGLGFLPGLKNKTDILFFVAAGLLLSLTIALRPKGGVIFQLLQAWLPERFNVYANDTLGVLPPKSADDDEPPVILIYIPERGITLRLSRCGIALKDWMEIAKTAQSGIYNQTLFERIFGREDEIGRTKYQVVSPLLAAEELGVLKQSGNGYKVTDYEGKEFFERLAKGDWRVLEKLPNDVVRV